VDGLINIDKTMACVKFRKAGLFNDPRIEIRRKVVRLAGETGGREDLFWLWEKVVSSAESDLARVAWESMLNVLKRADLAVFGEWMGKFDPGNADSKLSDEHRLGVLKIAEQRFSEAGRVDMLIRIREWLAECYGRSGNFEQAANYWGILSEGAISAKDKYLGRFQQVRKLELEDGQTIVVYLKGLDFPVQLQKKVFKNENGSAGVLYLITNNLTIDSDSIYQIYQKRWRIEEYHKSIKQNTALAKSPTRTVKTQTNHVFASIVAYVKLERLKLKTNLNHFAIRYKLILKANQIAFEELQIMKKKFVLLSA